ncbi:MAG: thymidine kinase [Halobacteriaceae archaeon]
MHAITKSGWIEAITGSMFSGKTEELLRRLRRAEIADQSVAAFTPAIDDRYGEEVLGSHAGRSWEATRISTEKPDEIRGEPFEPVPQLMAVAEYVEKFQAICVECGEPATRNQRLIEGEPAHVDDPTIMVGAEESYEARCRNCHIVRTD